MTRFTRAVVTATVAVVTAAGALVVSAASGAPAYAAARNASASSTSDQTVQASAPVNVQDGGDTGGPQYITCSINVSAPSKTLPPELVGASAYVTCDYPIASIELTEHVHREGSNVDVAVDHVLVSGVSSAGTVALAAFCDPVGGVYTNSAIASIDFPAGYSPQTASLHDSASSALGLGDCGVRVAVPNVAGQARNVAVNTLATAGLNAVASVVTVHESVDSGHVVGQSPTPGSAVIPGSTVNIFIGQWDGSHL